MAKIEFRDATQSDALFVGKHLRQSDIDEVVALGTNPERVVEMSRRASDYAWTGLINGVPSMVFGCSGSPLSEVGEVWALGTDECTRHPRPMLVFGRAKLTEMLELYPVLENYCDARYEAALRWLVRIGFSVSQPVRWGKNGELFCKITAKMEV